MNHRRDANTEIVKAQATKFMKKREKSPKMETHFMGGYRMMKGEGEMCGKENRNVDCKRGWKGTKKDELMREEKKNKKKRDVKLLRGKEGEQRRRSKC